MSAAAQSPSENFTTGQSLLAGVDLVIFDFDGVVVDSEVISLSTLQGALGEYGIAMTGKEVRDRFLGRSLSAVMELVEARATHGDIAKFKQVWEQVLFDQFRAALEPLSSIEALLDQLNASGTRYCIASSGSVERIEVALAAVSLKERFTHIFSAEFVSRGKPEPDLFLYAADQLDVVPDRCLVIEDSPSGVIAAKRAEMRCAGFVGGSHLAGMREAHAAQLTELGADYILPRFAVLLADRVCR